MKLLDDVKREIAEARQKSDSIHLIYLNSRGEVERVSVDGTGTTDNLVQLLELSAKPCFQVCTVFDIVSLVAPTGEPIYEFSQLQAALDGAIAERTRFYAEREAEHGSYIWPRVAV